MTNIPVITDISRLNHYQP